ncbi:hypothetical protein NMG60_11005982 [Bertholletia excelsa]
MLIPLCRRIKLIIYFITKRSHLLHSFIVNSITSNITIVIHSLAHGSLPCNQITFSLPAGVPLQLTPFTVLLKLIPHSFQTLSPGIHLFTNMMASHSSVKILSGEQFRQQFLSCYIYSNTHKAHSESEVGRIAMVYLHGASRTFNISG